MYEPAKTAKVPMNYLQEPIKLKKLRSPKGKDRKKTVSKDKHLL